MDVSIPLCACVLLVMVSSVRLSEVGTLGQPYLWNCSHQTPQTLNFNQSKIYWQNQNNSLTIFFYNKGSPEKKHINPQFINRTSVFPDLLASGNLSLLIDPLKVTDDGLKVKVMVGSAGEETTTMCEQQISVAAPYVLMLNLSQNKAVCSAVGGYPESNLTWTGVDETTAGPIALSPALNTPPCKEPNNGTYSVSSSISVEDLGLLSVTCHLHNPRTNQSISLTKSIVPEHTDCPSGEKDWIAIGFAIFGWASFVVAVLTVLIRCCIEKHRNKPASPSPEEVPMQNLS